MTNEKPATNKLSKASLLVASIGLPVQVALMMAMSQEGAQAIGFMVGMMAGQAGFTAVLLLIMALIASPTIVSIVLSIRALSQIAKSGDFGKSLAATTLLIDLVVLVLLSQVESNLILVFTQMFQTLPG